MIFHRVIYLNFNLLPETFLNSGTSSHDCNLEIQGYNLVRADHPSNSKRWGVRLYVNNLLPLKFKHAVNAQTLRL